MVRSHTVAALMTAGAQAAQRACSQYWSSNGHQIATQTKFQACSGMCYTGKKIKILSFIPSFKTS